MDFEAAENPSAMASCATAAPVEGSPSSLADFEEVFEQHARYVMSSLRRLGVQGSDIEDLTHDVFVASFRHRGQFDVTRPIRPWLFGIAYRLAGRQRRRQDHGAALARLQPPEAVDAAPLPDERLARKQQREMVLQALDAVEFERRAVLVMHDVDGRTVPEIAGTLEVPLNTTYSRLRLARGEFAAALHRLQTRQGGA